MNNHSILFFSALAVAQTFSLNAVETKTWTLDSKSDYEKAKLERIALRSDGKLTLAPTFAELLDPEEPYLWAAAQDSKGVIYAGGGSPGASSAKLFIIGRDGKSKKLADLPGSEIHAIAIDGKDRVFAATSPDGKVYLVNGAGKADVYYDPKTKYIWALSLNSAGDLFVATGDKGEIHKVTAAGKGSVFYKTEETHARSMTIDSKDNLIVGTEPGGLILRISPSGAGFVLHQAGKKEVTSVAVSKDGIIYAAAVGGARTPLPAPPPPPLAPVATGPGAAAPPAPPLSFAISFSGGSEVYRIDADGAPARIWSDGQDIVYSILVGCDGKLLVATGNKGRIHRIDSDLLSTQLVAGASTQITQLTIGKDNQSQCAVLAAAANLGKLFRLGPGMEQTGLVTGDALDAGWFSSWGKLTSKQSADGSVTLESRSGNTERPGSHWSPWAVVTDRIPSPSARFLQYRMKLAAASGPSPEVSEIEIAYLPRNVAPTVDEIEITPFNYKFPPPTSSSSTPATKNFRLGQIGQRPPAPSSSSDSSPTEMNYAKGFTGARWRSADRNGDTLQYKLELRGVGEREWKPLKEKLAVRHHSWDSTAFADGEYRLQVTASDRASNPEGQGLEGKLVSEPFLIDNTPPKITGLTATPAGNKVNVRFRAADALSQISHAEYSINGGEWILVEPTTRITDAKEHEYVIAFDKGVGSEQSIAVRVSDQFDNQTVEKTILR